jgi:transposase
MYVSYHRIKWRGVGWLSEAGAYYDIG